MRRISLSVCVLLLVLLIFSGCGKAIPNNGDDSSGPANSENTLISITSNGETTLPYLHFSWGSLWTGNAWASVDALQLISELPDIAPELPAVSYHDDFTVQYKEDVSYSYMSVYDDNFQQLYNNADLSYLGELPEGTYYVGIAVTKQGDYILFENRYESSGYDCVFKLVVDK